MYICGCVCVLTCETSGLEDFYRKHKATNAITNENQTRTLINAPTIRNAYTYV